jgi:hypothetical protein
MRRNRPAEFGSLSSVPKHRSRFKIRSSEETGRTDTGSAANVAVAAVLFSRIRYGQSCIVVRGQDAGGCGLGSWQHDLLDAVKSVPSGQAVAEQRVGTTPKASAIMNAKAVLIIGVDVANRILVGNILRAPNETAALSHFMFYNIIKWIGSIWMSQCCEFIQHHAGSRHQLAW